MADTSPFAPFVPGFDFLQGLVSNAGAALPGIGQWVAPTLNPQELEKRIDELRTVQFWLEQNARMLGATIQALEVQRMTLSTLKTMNVQMEDLRDALQIKPVPMPAPAPAAPMGSFFSRPLAPAATDSAPAPSPAIRSTAQAAQPNPPATPDLSSAAPPPGVDPMQWWGALTQQFTQLAAQAIQQTTAAVPAASSSGGKTKPAAAKASSESSDQDTDTAAGPKAGRPIGKAAAPAVKVPVRGRSSKPKE